MSNSERQVRKYQIAIFVLAVIAVSAVGAAFYSSTRPTGVTIVSTTSTAGVGPADPNTLIVDTNSEPDSIDPSFAGSNEGAAIAENVYLPLIGYNLTQGGFQQIIPVLAKSYEQSADGLHFTFTLRQDAYFSNGDPFNAYVVWYNVYRDLINQGFIGGAVYGLVLTSAGVTAGDLNTYASGKLDTVTNNTLLKIMMSPANCVQVLSAYQVQFNLVHPYAPWLTTITYDPAIMIDPKVEFQNGGVQPGAPNTYMNNNAPVGIGPYIVKEWVHNDHITLVKNPNYWVTKVNGNEIAGNPFFAIPSISTVIVYSKQASLTREQDLLTNRVQIGVVDPLRIPVVTAPGTGVVMPNLGPTMIMDYLALDTFKFPLNNTKIRMAVVHAINYTKVSVLTNGFLAPAIGPLSPQQIGYDTSLQQYDYNPTLAKSLLAQAGFPGGTGLPTIVMEAWSGAPWKVVALQSIQQDLAAVGIQSSIVIDSKIVHINEYFANRASWEQPGHPDMMMDVSGLGPDGDLYQLGITIGYVPYSYNNTQYWNLMLQEENQLDNSARINELHQIQHLIYDDAAFVWLGVEVNSSFIGPLAFRDYVKGYVFSTALYGPWYASLHY